MEKIKEEWTNIRIDPELKDRAKVIAKQQHRSLSSQLELWIEQAISAAEVANV